MVSKNELGKLKQEYFVKEGIFICGKLYCLRDKNDCIHIKEKGVDSNS